MKRFLYSPYTKAIAVILFVLSLALGALCAVDGIAELSKEETIVYRFENSFSESRYLQEILYDPELIVTNIYGIFYRTDDQTEVPETQSGARTVDGKTFEESLTSAIQNLGNIDKIDYFISANGTVFTNCGAESAQDLMTADFYRYNARESDGTLHFEASPSSSHYYYHLEEIGFYDSNADVTVCAAINKDYAAECITLWERQSHIILNTIPFVLCFIVAALIFLFYLIIVTGKTKDGELKPQLIDNLWTEIHLAVVGIPIVATVALGIVSLEAFFYDQLPMSLMRTAVVSAVILCGLLVLMSLLSLTRKFKCHIFLETCLIFKVLRWTWNISKRFLTWCLTKTKSGRKVLREALGQKSGRMFIGLLLLYTALIGFFGVLTPFAGFPLLFGILLFLFAAFVLAHRAKDLDAIKSGVKEIRNGNLQYKITEPKSDDLKSLAEDINDITDGLDRSIGEKLKAERMKTELITNVSHDLKTPLTSIINYTTLLSDMKNMPEEAKDYITIIAKKSEGLKNLTRDLFDISKVQSGNETFEIEKLDAAQLIEQAMGEHNNEIQNSELNFCVKTEKDLCFFADGRKMSRVMGNLIENTLHYSMKNTRVFLEAYERNSEVVMEIKNISANPMNFDAEEITARFVRGDSSRTDGGNGLGLAIAKSYTEACGGTFQITIDGDLFKATITFPKK